MNTNLPEQSSQCHREQDVERVTWHFYNCAFFFLFTCDVTRGCDEVELYGGFCRGAFGASCSGSSRESCSTSPPRTHQLILHAILNDHHKNTNLNTVPGTHSNRRGGSRAPERYSSRGDACGARDTPQPHYGSPGNRADGRPPNCAPRSRHLVGVRVGEEEAITDVVKLERTRP